MTGIDLLPPSCLSIKTFAPEDVRILLGFLSDGNSIALNILDIVYENGGQHRGQIHSKDVWKIYVPIKDKLLSDHEIAKKKATVEDENDIKYEEDFGISEEIKKPKTLQSIDSLNLHYKRTLDKYLDANRSGSRLSKLNKLLRDSGYQLLWNVEDGPRRGLFISSDALPPGVGIEGMAIFCPETVKRIWEYFHPAPQVRSDEFIDQLLKDCPYVLKAENYYHRFKNVKRDFERDKYSLDELNKYTKFPEGKWGGLKRMALSDVPICQIVHAEPAQGKSILAAHVAKAAIQEKNWTVYIVDCKHKASLLNDKHDLLSIILQLKECAHLFLVEDLHLVKREADQLFFSTIENENIRLLATCRSEHEKHYTEYLGLKNGKYIGISKLRNATVEIAQEMFKKYNLIEKHLRKGEPIKIKDAITKEFGGDLAVFKWALSETKKRGRIIPSVEHAEKAADEIFKKMVKKRSNEVNHDKEVVLIACALAQYEYALPISLLNNDEIFKWDFPNVIKDTPKWLQQHTSEFHISENNLFFERHPQIARYIIESNRNEIKKLINGVVTKPRELIFSNDSDWNNPVSIVIGIYISNSPVEIEDINDKILWRPKVRMKKNEEKNTGERTKSKDIGPARSFIIGAEYLWNGKSSDKEMALECLIYAIGWLLPIEYDENKIGRIKRLLEWIEKSNEKIRSLKIKELLDRQKKTVDKALWSWETFGYESLHFGILPNDHLYEEE